MHRVRGPRDAKNPEVAVLLATYNGERYIAEQIQSIVGQFYDRLILYVRDDGSSDRTIPLLLQVLEKSGRPMNLRLESGEHVGIPQSYFQLMEKVDLSHDYYAFADQDDVWAPTKMQHAVEMLARLDETIPLLYFCRQRFVTSDLRPLGFSPLVTRPGLSNALVQNPAKGCTQVFNRSAMAILRKHLPKGIPYHDWWVYLTVAAFGQVIYDARIQMDYRLHDASTVGETLGGLKRNVKRAIRVLIDGDFQARRQAEIFLNIHGGALSKASKETIERFVKARGSMARRVRYALSMEVRRLRRWETDMLRLLVVLGRY
ncbi:glycosyltransferase [Desulfosoma sp.]|uniref:glycosyltransferase n=2 Tax=Desulfosoma sp. TaxID=2603217 RepID=UPI00404B11C2